MHTEWIEIPEAAAEMINHTRQTGGRVIAVGTTSCRTLESAALPCGGVRAVQGETGIFITPGYTFKMTGALITNFHLPGSTLLMLVSAFYTREGMLAAYEEAVRERYRFFSFGDAMLIV
jgi:S-adenosylmethionine:tRNA ribosyltransferase-isomerase